MNIYGKEATAYYSLHEGLRFLTRRHERTGTHPLCAKRYAG